MKFSHFIHLKTHLQQKHIDTQLIRLLAGLAHMFPPPLNMPLIAFLYSHLVLFSELLLFFDIFPVMVTSLISTGDNHHKRSFRNYLMTPAKILSEGFGK